MYSVPRLTKTHVTNFYDLLIRREVTTLVKKKKKEPEMGEGIMFSLHCFICIRFTMWENCELVVVESRPGRKVVPTT